MIKKTTTARDVVLFIPNLIGYGRVLSTVGSFLLMVLFPNYWHVALVLYVSSFVGDLFDGMAARRFDQCSTFGGLLDMVTDRCSTLGLLFVLSAEYGGQDQQNCELFRLLFLLLAILDIASHWCHMYSTLLLQAHHKSSEGNADRFFLVRWYYSHYWLFGYCCVATEFVYIFLYALPKITAVAISATEEEDYAEILRRIVSVLLNVCIPGAALKQIINVCQLCSSCFAVAEYDAKTRNAKYKA